MFEGELDYQLAKGSIWVSIEFFFFFLLLLLLLISSVR